MKFQLTDKGKKLWPTIEYDPKTFRIWSLISREPIANGPADIKALIDLDLIELQDNTQVDAQDKFIECSTCRAKPGSPHLCASCQHNRELIARLLSKEE